MDTNNSPLIIPDGFNAWPKEPKIEHYYAAGVCPHPCYGPSDKCSHPGKQPRWEIERRLTASLGEVMDHFRLHPNDNVGIVPTGGHIVLDLDLVKEYKERGDRSPLEAWRVLYPKLFEQPYVPCDRGFHNPLFCTAIPQGQGKIEVHGILPGLNLEVHVGTGNPANVIVPPSIHQSGHRYLWAGSGAETSGDFRAVLRRLNVKIVFDGAPQEKAQETGAAWKSRFKGDLRTLNTDGLCQRLGIYGQALDAEHGGACTIKCPWSADHTGGGEDWTPRNTSSAILHTFGHYPVFDCKHVNAGCTKRSIKDFLFWCEEQEPGIVDRHCRRDFRPPTRADVEQEGLDECTRTPWPPSDAKPADFEQEIFYPEDSILSPFMEYGRTLTEGSDAYLLGSALALCSSLVGRRIWIDFGGPLYLNLFTLIVGKPGDRKSFTIKLAQRIAHVLLGSESFLAPILSHEGLFQEYCQEEGGCPDKVCIVDDAAILLSTWRLSSYGERVADTMLRLYDCEGLSEAFRRNKKESTKTVKRTIPQTSTVLLFGATFADALFSRQKSQQGLARRFLYYLATSPERFIEWPDPGTLVPIVDQFKSLLSFKGSLELAAEAKDLWRSFQLGNRARIAEVPDNRPDLAHALASEPTHALKVAALFELATAAAQGRRQKRTIGLQALELAANHVAQNLRASAYLFHRAQQLEAAQQGEEILAKVRTSFPISNTYPDTIFASRTKLTSTFCHHTARRGSLSTEELYLQILPELIRRGQAQLCVKKGKLEIYAFRASDSDPEPGMISTQTGANSTDSTNSPSPHTYTLESIDAHINAESF
jgi:hypothetical protein